MNLSKPLNYLEGEEKDANSSSWVLNLTCRVVKTSGVEFVCEIEQDAYIPALPTNRYGQGSYEGSLRPHRSSDT